MASSQTLTDAALNDIQSKITEVFAGDGPYKYSRNYPGFSAQAILSRNSARTNPIFSNGQCIGQEIHWLKTNTLTLDYNGDGSDDNTECEVADGQFPESDKATLTDNVRVRKNVTVEDNLCGSLFNDSPASLDGRDRAATLVADELSQAMLAVRTGLDQRIIDFLDTNKTGVNNDANLPSYINFNGTADQFEADASYFQSADFLTDVDALVANNRMMSYFMLSGRRNFYNAVTNSDFRRLNDDERYLVRFDTADIIFDIRTLDSRLNTAAGTTGQGFTFAIGEGTYAIWNRVEVPSVPTQIDFDKWAFYIEDPFLTIRENGVLRPVRYTVLYQKSCVGRQAGGLPYFSHNFELFYEGGLAAAPADSDGHTGILKLAGIPGV